MTPETMVELNNMKMDDDYTIVDVTGFGIA